MSHQWMVEALREVRQHAFQNYFVTLAEKLDDVVVTAVEEIHAREGSLISDEFQPAEDSNLDRTPA
jgi:hypothetical protein